MTRALPALLLMAAAASASLSSLLPMAAAAAVVAGGGLLLWAVTRPRPEVGDGIEVVIAKIQKGRVIRVHKR